MHYVELTILKLELVAVDCGDSGEEEFTAVSRTPAEIGWRKI